VRHAAVLGSPIAHSLSPVLHRAAYAGLGLADWTYEAFECTEDGLAAFLDGLDASWAGLSLTMPLKREALKLADGRGPLAVQVGGANTILLRDGRRFAENTDVHGIVTALTEAGIRPGGALVLGGGATAASALVALHELGLTAVTLVVRDRRRAAEAAAAGERAGLAISVRLLDDLPELLAAQPPDGLIVSTVPGDAAAPYAPLITQARPDLAVFDVVYAPWPTTLGAAARAAGSTVVGGLPMLLHQAVRQVELMTGRTDVPVEAMRAAALAEQERRSR
jgi:shikimate dehydrogenase